MKIDLTERTAFVTGGNLGIGRGVALALAQCGAEVALTYYSHQDEADETVKMIEDLGQKAYAFQVDATDSAQVNQVVEQVAQTLGGHIDILMNNAGYMVGRCKIADMSDEHFRRTMDVNLSSTFYVTRAVLPYMKTGWGRIVNMASLAARNGGGPGAAVYAASKAAVIALTMGLAKELADRGITVNGVAPGLILETPFHQNFTTDAGIQAMIEATPLKRGGTPADVAGAVIYFVSDLGSFVTGEIAEINGGLYFA